MRVRQHIPNFMDGFEPEKTYVFTAEDLDRVEFIRRWKEHPGFHRLSVHRNYYDGKFEDGGAMHLLLAELNEGKEWWVLAYLQGDDSLEILAKYPEWEAK